MEPTALGKLYPREKVFCSWLGWGTCLGLPVGPRSDLLFAAMVPLLPVTLIYAE